MAPELGHSVSRLSNATEIHRLESVAHASDEVRRRRDRQEQQKKRQKKKTPEQPASDEADEMEGRLLPAPDDDDYDDGDTHLDVLV